MVELKTPEEIALMREAGRVVAHALEAARQAAAPGRTTADLDRVAAKVIADAGADPLFLGHQPAWAPTPFPGVACVSVNDEIVHGVPSPRRLVDGDVVSVDCDARPGHGLRLRPGPTIAIEPMLVRGGSDGYAHADDGWTVLSDDGTRAAHCEHTVAVTDDGPVVLTLP